MPLFPRLTRDHKRTDLINQIFIGSVLMRPRVKRGDKYISTHLLFIRFRECELLFVLHYAIPGSLRFLMLPFLA